MAGTSEDIVARLDVLLKGQQAAQATLEEISKCILKAPRAPQFDLTIYNGGHEDRTRVTEGGEGSVRQDILPVGAAEALRKQVSAVEAAVAELRLLKVDLQAAQGAATRAWEPSAEASPSRATDISRYGEHVTRKELVHAVDVLRDELRGARTTSGTPQVGPAEIAQLQKELMAAVQASVERLGTELKDSSGRELALMASRTMVVEKQALDVGEVVAMLQREVAGLRGAEPGLTHKEVEQLVGTLIDADFKRRAAAEEESGPASVFDMRSLAVENTALRARLAAQLELAEVHAGGGKVGEWRVVFSRGVANVRRTKEYDAEILGTKRHGEVCLGSQEGDWLALAGELGFIRIFGRVSGERILEPCDPTLEVSLEGPVQLASEPKELQRRPAAEPVSEKFLPSAEKLGEEMRHELLTLWRAVAELADVRCVSLPSRVASEPLRETVVEPPLPAGVLKMEPLAQESLEEVQPEKWGAAAAGCEPTSAVHAPPSAHERDAELKDLPPPPAASTATSAPEQSCSRPAESPAEDLPLPPSASTATSAPEQSHSRPAEPAAEDLPPAPAASTATSAPEQSCSRPAEPAAEDLPPPPAASAATSAPEKSRSRPAEPADEDLPPAPPPSASTTTFVPEQSRSRPAEPEDEDWKRRGSYVEGGVEVTPVPSEEPEVKSEARAVLTTSRSVTFEEVEEKRTADSDAVERDSREQDADGMAGMLAVSVPGESELVGSAATGPAELEAPTAKVEAAPAPAPIPEAARVSQPQEAPASPARARRTSLADVATKRRGSRVVVLQDFPSDSADASPLKRSLHGVVKEIDAEGDVLIEFADGTAQWVFEDNFDKLGLIDTDELVRSKKSKAAGVRKTATIVALRVGHEVTVREAFQSDSEERVVLSKGVKGVVRNIDEDGDALIEFEGVDKPQWIFKLAFDKLATPEDDADEASEASSSSDSKTDDEAQLKPIEKGETLCYNSVSQGGWIRCKVVAVRKADGAVQVDVKSGYWFTAKDQTEKLRRKGQPLYWVGQALQYKSVTLGKWTDCEAMAVREDGAIQIDAKGDTWLTLEEQLEKIRMRAMQAGLLVSVARDFESDSEKKRPLRQGTRGIIKEVDEEGDALVVFDDVPNTPEWVFKGNFDKLRLVRAQRPDVPNTAVPNAMEEQISEVSKPSEADAGAGVGQVVGLHVGAKVTVMEDFRADSEEQTVLRCGQRGVVKQIDDEGDALIDFEAHQQCQWVYRPNFGKLKMAKAEAPKAVEADIAAMDVKQLKDYIASAGLSFVDCFAKKDLVVRAGEAQAKLRAGR